MTNNSILLGIMNRMKLSDSSFTERIISQKTIYLLQELGISTTYSFKWYNYGVYSKELADNMFSVSLSQVNSSTIGQDEEKIINDFTTFAGIDQKNPIFLEMASSTVFLSKQTPFITKQDLFNELIQLKPHLNNQNQFNQVLDKLNHTKINLSFS